MKNEHQLGHHLESSNSTLGSLLQQIPAIPDAVKSEGMSAVLFVLVLVPAIVFLFLRQAPSLISAWKASGARETETGLIVAELVKLTGSVEKLSDRVAECQRMIVEGTGRIGQLASEIAGVRSSNHGIRNLMAQYEARQFEVDKHLSNADRRAKPEEGGQ